MNETPHPQTPDVILTGATGHIGRFLLLELLRRGRRVLALVRHAERRKHELAEWLGEHSVEPDGLSVGEFSLEAWGSGCGTLEGLPVDGVRDVYHLAARFAFGLERADARLANVDASLRFLEAASRLPRLRRYLVVSGYRVSAESDHSVEENYRRLGAYEASKMEEHTRLRQRASELGVALNLVNPCSVIGDTESGETLQTTGAGEVVRQLFSGKMPAQVGSERTFVPLVGVEHVARFMAELPLHRGVANSEFWLLHPDAPKLSELVERMAKTLGVPAPRLRLPVGLVRALPRGLTGAEPESLGFLSEDRYPTAAADRLADEWGFSQPAFDGLVDAWLGYLVGTRFLRRRARAPRFVATRAGQILAEGGRSSDLVLLHGLPLDGTSWDPLLQRLQQDALVVDLPGLGRSGVSSDKFAYGNSEWLEDLALPTPVRLVGHSLGCAVALDYALRHPGGVKEVLLVAPAFLGGRMDPWLRVPPLVQAMLRWSGRGSLVRQLFNEQRPRETEQVVDGTFESLQRPHVRRSVARGLAWAGSPRVRAQSLDKLSRVVASGVSVRVLSGEFDQPSVDK
ncbi:MAG: alpha/beta fold hydrolase, partial [Myxococcales bacterium]|nr:alpha/beta fold hydrolase [Myxococcales bacterium]